MEDAYHAHANFYSIQANILVNQNGRACLADFGLLTIELDPTDTTPSNSFQGGGTIRWMGPELFYPEKLGLTGRRPTKPSDCYALGMVAYEVLSGKVPFHHYKYYKGIAAIWRILNGEHPERLQGDGGLWFTDDIWSTLERCWELKLDARPSAEEILRGLEKASMFWTPAQTMACPLPTDLSAQNLDSSTEESTEEDETSSTSQALPSYLIDAEGALRRLMDGAVPPDELSFLIETVVSNLKAAKIVQFLQGSDAQTFIDMLDRVCDPPLCLRSSFVAEFSPARHLTASTSLRESAQSV